MRYLIFSILILSMVPVVFAEGDSVEPRIVPAGTPEVPLEKMQKVLKENKLKWQKLYEDKPVITTGKFDAADVHDGLIGVRIDNLREPDYSSITTPILVYCAADLGQSDLVASLEKGMRLKVSGFPRAWKGEVLNNDAITITHCKIMNSLKK